MKPMSSKLTRRKKSPARLRSQRSRAETERKYRRRSADSWEENEPAPYVNDAEVRGLYNPQNAGQLQELGSIGTSGSRGGFFSMLGGLDGMMSMVSKVHKMYGMFQSMMPMFRLLGSFGMPKAATASLKRSVRRKPKQSVSKRSQRKR